MARHRCRSWLAALAVVLAPLPAAAQPSPEEIEDSLVDLNALVIATTASMRCGLVADTLTYLTPLEGVAADYRITQLGATLDALVPDLPETMSAYRAEANGIACGTAALAPYLDFGRIVARDLVEIGLKSWQRIEHGECAFFTAPDFDAAIERAEAAAAGIAADPDPARRTYITEGAAFWASTFVENCLNMNFEPEKTLPGLIALALPFDPAAP